MKFPTLDCRCTQGHEWGTLIPGYWFFIKNIECPHCNSPIESMKAGEFRTMEEVRKAVGVKPKDSK